MADLMQRMGIDSAPLMAVEPPAPRLLRKAAMGASVLTFSYMNGAMNNPTVMGVSVDAAAALATTLGHVALDLAGINVPGHLAAAVDAVSDGAIASYLAKLGTGFGAEARASQSTSSSTKGYESFGTTVGALSASEAEIYVR